MINVADHLPLLNRILADVGLPPETLELVTDVQAWCYAHTVEEEHPFRQAICLPRASDEACRIIMSNRLTDEMITSGKLGMEIRGFAEDVSAIDTDLKYLVHLMLHEVACHVLDTVEQASRDRWAFERLPHYFG